MNELGKGFDGTVEKAISSTEKLKNLPKILQKYMMWGDYKSGLITKIDGSKFGDSIDGENIQNYVAQISNLDKAQRNAIISVTKLDKESKAAIQDLIDLIQTGSRINGKVFESSLKSAGNSEINQGDINSLMNALGMKNGDNYALPDTNEVKKNLNMWAKAAENADAKTRLMNAGIIESTKNGYAMTDSFKKMIGIEEVDGVVKTGLTAKQLALNAVMQIGKQLALSFGVAIATWAISKAVECLMNLKTRSEELVATMNDSHDAAEQATKDVEEIQSKIDDLNKSLKDAGAKKIEDIVDPAERERLQAINDMLQAQLELKKQLEKDANDKANADTSAVVNDKTEDSIVKSRTVNVSYAEGGANAGTHQVAEKVSKTESLEEHTAALNELIDKRRELATAGKEDTQEYKNNEAAITAETKKVEELSSAVSENMNSYETDADSFAKYKGEYVAGTNAMTAATKALANANDDVGESALNYETLLQKMKAAKADVDNGDSERTDYRYMSAVDSLKRSGITTGDQILTLSHDSSKGTDQQKTAIAMLREEAAKAKVSIEDYVHGLEEMGEVSTTAALHTKELSTTISELDNIQSAYKTLTETTKEYNKSGYLTMDTLQSLLQLDPKYYNCLIDTNGQLKVNTQTIRTMTKARLADAKAEQLQLALDKMTTIKDLKSAEEYLGTATANAADAEEQFAAMYNQILTTDVRMNGPQYNVMKEALDQIMASYYSIAKLIDETGNAPLDKLFGTTDKTSKSTKQATSAIDAWSTLSSAMEEYNKQGSISLNTMKSLMGLEEKYTACLKKQGNELTIDATKFRDMIQTELKAAAETADASDKTKAKVDQYNKILKYLDENAKDGTISLNELRDAIEGVGASLDKAQEKTSGLKSAFGTIHDILNTDNPAGALTSDNVESVVDLIQEHKELKDILFDESGNLQINEESLKNATIALLENEKAATKDAAIQAVLQKSINDLSSGVISITDFLKGLNTELDDVDKKLDKFQSGFSDITDIVDEYNLYGKLTQDSMQKLLRLDPQYLECLEKEGDQLKFNAAQYRMLYAEQIHQFALNAKTNAQRKVYTGILSDIFGFTPEQTEEYESALQGYADTVKEVQDAGLAKYGNVDNINRTRIDWTAENMEKYHDFVAEQNELEPDSIVEGSYSTVLGASSAFDTGDGEKEIAYTPMLQTEDGVVPLTSNEIASYINDVIAKASKLKGGATAENILKIDAEGLSEGVAGEEVKVKNMIAGVEGQIVNGVELTAADIAAIGGETAENLQKYFGESSEWAGKSMHDVQSKIFDSKENVEKLTSVLNAMGIDGAKVMQLLEEHFKDANTSAEKLKAALNDIKDVFSSLLSLLSSANDKSNNDLKIWGDVMNKVIEKRIEALNKQKEALEENNEATERAIELSKAQDALARAQQQRTTRVYTENGYEWQANAEDVRTAREDLADKQREWNNKDAEKAIDDQIKKYNEFKDKLSEVMDDIGKSWKDYQKELEYTAQIQKMTITQMEGSLDGYHNKIIASLNTGSAITGIQNLITNLESLINTLTKVNNLYSMFKTGEYKDLGTKGLWNTIKGFFNKGGEEAATESGKTVETFFEVLKNKVQTSGNGLIDKFKGIWEAIKAGAQNTFKGSGGGIVSTVIDGFKTIGDAVSKSKVGSTLIKGAGKLVTGAGRLIKSAVGAIGAAGTSAIPVVGAVAATAGLAIYGTAKNYKHQKEIWSNKEDGFGKKALKSVATFIWDTSPIGAVVNLCKDIFGKSKETAENTKDTANSSSETAENTKKATGVTNLTINATQGTISEENKTEESAPEGKKQSAWDRFWGSKLWFWNWGKKASGDKKIKHSGTYNVDEAGPEMLVRQPASGRYTYLETGDGVVPADITSRLFEMGGNPDKWFSDQLAKNGSASMVQSRSSGGISLSIGDVNVNNPVGDSDALASELVNRLPNRIVQQLNKR